MLKFSQKYIVNWCFWKTQFFWVGHFEFLFQTICFSSSPWKSVTNYVKCEIIEWDSIFMIMKVYSQKWPTPNINTGSVTLSQLEVADYAHQIQITTGTPGCSLTAGSLYSVSHVRRFQKCNFWKNSLSSFWGCRGRWGQTTSKLNTTKILNENSLKIDEIKNSASVTSKMAPWPRGPRKGLSEFFQKNIF